MRMRSSERESGRERDWEREGARAIKKRTGQNLKYFAPYNNYLVRDKNE